MNLAGEWRAYLDYEGTASENGIFEKPLKGVLIKFPGTTNENKLGEKLKIDYQMNKENVRSLRQEYKYIGKVFYERYINIPKEWGKSEIFVFFERIMIKSTMWIDGVFVGDFDSISTPHKYDITNYVQAGKTHRLTIMIDHSEIYILGDVARGLSDDTQTIWNGIIGKMELISVPKIYIKDVQVFPDIENKTVRICTEIENKSGKVFSKEIKYIVNEIRYNEEKDKFEKILEKGIYINNIEILAGNNKVEFIFNMGENINLWDEFEPNLYEMNVSFDETEKNVVFGMRDIHCEGKKIILNNKQIYLRGTLDCCYFPLTGYPVTDLKNWIKIFKTAKEYGLNHIRFHSWCPPENAFLAADICGIYILAENVIWLNDDKNVCMMAVGDCKEHYDFIPKEAEKIIDTYGNHASFCMFSNGNELRGDFELLENIIAKLKSKDKRHIYTLTTNFSRPLSKSDDYYCANVSSEGKALRARSKIKRIVRDNHYDFSEAVNEMPVPCISHEIGQYCVYPSMKEISKYTGKLRPSNLETIRNDLMKKGLYDNAENYMMASGKLAALMYKEEIEASLRTKDFGGFELLGLNDYQGQCTATVGILDEFWQSKGIIEPEEFRNFCSATVPLMTMYKRIYLNTEKFNAEVMLTDFGKEKILNPEFKLLLEDMQGNLLLDYKVEGNKIKDLDLSFIKKPLQIKAKLVVEGTDINNSWDLWVYPDEKEDKGDFIISESLTAETVKALKEGKTVLLIPSEETLLKSNKPNFAPVFWSPAFFISDNICGAMCQEKHKLFESFPTEFFINYQWQDIIESSQMMFTDDLGIKSIVTPVPNFFNNAELSIMFETFVDKGKLFVCSVDLEKDFITVKALKNAIYKYIKSEDFLPENRISLDELKNLFKMESIVK